MVTSAARRMLGFAGELLRVRRTRPGVSDQRFGALRPAVLRLKALSFAKRFLWARATCNSSVRARCGRRGFELSAGELAGSRVACGPRLRQQSPASAASSGACGPLRARKRETHPLDVLLASYSCLNDPEWSSDQSPAYPRSGRIRACSGPASAGTSASVRRNTHYTRTARNETREQY